MTGAWTRRPAFWVAFGALGLAGAVAALRLFTVALPTISLDIEMDRSAAMAAAEALAEGRGWAPSDARSAASFGQVDPEVQTYVELEGGGRGAFQELTDAGVYEPYQWRVRRFAEGSVEEAEVRFTPAGSPYGFELTLAEDDPGDGNLDGERALSLAEEGAAAWPVDLAAYALVESSERLLPGGRRDHTFVYERTGASLAEARFRLRLVVGGNRLSELTHFVLVPEAFSQRYADMRATNDAIALVSQSVFILLYVLLGAGVGTALLLRSGWIEWRAALGWGALIALLMGLNSLNALPLAWMGYDTALSTTTFVLQNVAAAGAIVFLGAPLLAFFFLAGESLGRRAFPEHLQQWRFWSPDVARSTSALGLTVAAYLLVGLQLGYVVLFYLGTSRLEGWWSPADALVQPDLIATYVPWLQAVSLSLFASFWEESIFRAVPIACAALIGARYGRRGPWIWGAVVLQAVVFAAGHANYPQQPPYARVVELTLPALVWGVVYVRFGLVPTILAHFLYDLALMSSLLFAAEALFDQGVVVLVALLPLAIVLWARRGGRASAAAPDSAYNRAWTPGEREAAGAAEPAHATAPVPEAETPTPEEPSTPPLAPLPAWTAALAGALGVALFTMGLRVAERPPRLEVTRQDALATARAEATRIGFGLEGWSEAVTAGSGMAAAHEYVFREAGADAYDALLGTFLAPPQWIVRFVDWEAEAAERVEELVVNVAWDGSLRRVARTLPEARAGATLPQDSARVLAAAALPSGQWEEVGARETTHEARTDWRFTYRAPDVLTRVAGEGRASVAVLGDEVTDMRRFVQVPEAWERAQREAASRRLMVSGGLLFALVLLYGSAAVVAIVVWSRGGLQTEPLRRAGALALLALALSFANGWAATPALFSTAQPFALQAGGAAIGLALFSLVGAAAIGLVIALAHSWSARPGATGQTPLLGVGLGLLLGGLAELGRAVLAGPPEPADLAGAAASLPSFAAPLDAVAPLLFVTGAVLLLSVAHRRFADRSVLRAVTGFAVLALGVVLVPDALQESAVTWVVATVAAVAVTVAVVRLVGRRPSLAPGLFGAVAALEGVALAVHRPYPGALVGGVLAVAVVTAVAWAWTRELAGPSSA